MKYYQVTFDFETKDDDEFTGIRHDGLTKLWGAVYSKIDITGGLHLETVYSGGLTLMISLGSKSSIKETTSQEKGWVLNWGDMTGTVVVTQENMEYFLETLKLSTALILPENNDYVPKVTLDIYVSAVAYDGLKCPKVKNLLDTDLIQVFIIKEMSDSALSNLADNLTASLHGAKLVMCLGEIIGFTVTKELKARLSEYRLNFTWVD